jgi:hypothetical protein
MVEPASRHAASAGGSVLVVDAGHASIDIARSGIGGMAAGELLMEQWCSLRLRNQEEMRGQIWQIQYYASCSGQSLSLVLTLCWWRVVSV